MSLTKVTYSMINGSPVNVLDYGADPTGVSDSSAAFALAVTTGRAIYAPVGVYKTSFSLGNGQAIYGDGPVKTVFTVPVGASYVIKIDATSSAKQFCSISNLSLQNITAIPYIVGILFNSASVADINDYHTMTNLLVDAFDRGVEVLGRHILCSWTNVRIINSNIGVNASTDNTSPAFNLNQFSNCFFNLSRDEGFKLVGQSIANSFYSCNFERNNTLNTPNRSAVYIEDSQNIAFRGCYFEDNGWEIAANATITLNSHALQLSGTYCIQPSIDCCYMSGSGSIIYITAGAVTGGLISNTRMIANGIAGYAFSSSATSGGNQSVMVYDSTNYSYGTVYFGIGGGLNYSTAVNQTSSVNYLSGDTTLDLLANKKITLNNAAPFTFTTINNRLPGCELWVSVLASAVTIPAAMMASGIDYVIPGNAILLVSGYPFDGKFVVMV